MIDIESQVFNYVSNALRAEYGNNISIYGEYVESPEQFPSVCLVEEDNAQLPENVTINREPETICNLMYTVNVYSNLVTGKKKQAKDISELIDDCMLALGFMRTMRAQIPNLDRTIYRVTTRYTQIYQKF